MNYSVAAELTRDKDKLFLSTENGLCTEGTAGPNKNVLKILLYILTNLESKQDSTGWNANKRTYCFAVTPF